MRFLFSFLFIVFATITAVMAEDAPLKTYALPNTQVIPLTAKSNGIDYELYVKLPKGYDESDEDYPVMITLDADYQFAIAANHVEHLADRGQAPDIIVVSIGYSYDPMDKQAYRINRTRDYTPVHTEIGGYGPAIQKYSGGGEAFADFIANEALPLIDARFRTNDRDRIFVGHSYGGMFGAWLLLTHPEMFNRYILVSPSLWFNDKMLLTEAAFADWKLERKTFVYMGVGAWENQPPPSYAMADDLEAFAALLKAQGKPDLVLEYRIFDDETHASIFPAVLSTGIRHLFQVME